MILIYIQEVLTANNYRKWMLNIPRKKKKTPHQPNNTNQPSKRPQRVIIPYVRGVSEKLQSVYKKYKITMIHKPTNTLRDHLVHPKDKIETLKECGTVYRIPCGFCDQFYIG